MKIGVVGSIWLNIPPKGYGGTEDVVYNLVNGLAKRGHQVTLFAAGTSDVGANVIPTIDKPLREKGVDWTNSGFVIYHMSEAFDRAGNFDLLHVHLNKTSDLVSLPLALLSKTPVVFTLHFKVFNKSERPDQYILLKKYRALPYISISDAQRRPNALNYIRTIYNGLDINKFPYSDSAGKYLAWLGKINPLKGTKQAILAAKKAGIKIYIMGPIDHGVPEMLSYYENEVKPLFDDKYVVFLGEVSHNEKTSILSGAMVLLNPIQWEEPFGLVMTEAQATGTPVIALDRGAVPEVVLNGKTGFIVKDIDEMVAKIPESGKLSRLACRQWVEQKFTNEKMVMEYEKAYVDVIRNWEGYVEKQKRLLRSV